MAKKPIMKSEKPIKNVMIFLPVAKTSVPVEFFISFQNAEKYLMSHADELPFEIRSIVYFEKTFPIDANRNICAERVIEGIVLEDGKTIFRPDISLWIDTDHELPIDSLFRLLNHDKPIMLGVYYIKVPRNDKPFYPVLFKRREDKPELYKAVMEFPEEEVFEVDFAGMGAACIHREVFEKLERPYFKYMRHPKGSSAYDSHWKNEHEIDDVSEDRWFWDQVKAKTDYPILVDPKVQFGHIGQFIYDKYMYNAWRDGYKKRLIEEHGQKKFEEKWEVMGKAGPYRVKGLKLVKKTG